MLHHHIFRISCDTKQPTPSRHLTLHHLNAPAQGSKSKHIHLHLLRSHLYNFVYVNLMAAAALHHCI